MSSLLHTCLLILCTFAFVCVHGRGGGSNPSCDVAIFVERGKSLVASLGQRTTLECPVDHCGEAIEVRWCKGDNCVAIIQNDNVDIMQTGLRNNRLVSTLIFKRISLEDDGFYRCYVNEDENEVISHAINVQVSASDPSCEVALLVKRGTSVEAAPGQRTTLHCPVENCGKSIKVNWCKDCDKCEDINPTDNLEITQTSSSKTRLLSSLTFKRISSDDAGLYKCCVTDNQNEEISHTINVKVSGEGYDPATDGGMTWLHFLLIGVGVAALAVIVLLLPVIKGYCQKRTMTSA